MGVIATAVMTGFTDGIARAFRKPFHVVVILSVMLRFKYVTDVESINPYRYSFAIIVHYGIGVIFAAVYVFLKIYTFGDSILFGCIIGTIGIVGWRIFFALHPGPPPIPLKGYLPTIWGGHIFLAIALYILTRLCITSQHVSESIPICLM